MGGIENYLTRGVLNCELRIVSCELQITLNCELQSFFAGNVSYKLLD